MANIEGAGTSGTKKPLSKLEQQGYIDNRPPAYTPPKQTYVNPSPANQISKANAANPYNPPPVNNTAQQQAIMFAAQQEAERRAREEAARRAQEEAARQAAIAAQRAQEERDRQAALAAQVQRDRLSSLVNQQKTSYQNRKLEQINTTPASASTGTYYWNNPSVPNRYVNPVTNERRQEEEPSIKPPNANLISQANAANPYNPPQSISNEAAENYQYNRQKFLEAERANNAPVNVSNLSNEDRIAYLAALRAMNAANVPTKYVNPVVANEISKANANIDRLEELKKWRRPPSTDVNQVQPILGQGLISSNLFPNVNVGLHAPRNDEETYRQLQAQRQQYDNAAQVNAYLGYGYRGYPEAYSYRTAQLPTQSLATTGTAVNMTPGLANVENINIPASTTVPNTASAAPAASTAAPLSSATAYPELYRYRTTNLNTAGYTSTAPAAGTIEKSTGKANEAAIPKGAKRSRPSYGQSTQVVKAPYRVGGYTDAELKAMGNEARKDLVGPDGSMLFEGYYKAPDGNYYPVNQGKANYALARGMTNPYQSWYYEGYTPDMEAYRNVYGTYYGYSPSWRQTGANFGGNRVYTYAPSGSVGSAYGAGFSGQPVGQQRYFNPVVNWSY